MKDDENIAFGCGAASVLCFTLAVAALMWVIDTALYAEERGEQKARCADRGGYWISEGLPGVDYTRVHCIRPPVGIDLSPKEQP